MTSFGVSKSSGEAKAHTAKASASPVSLILSPSKLTTTPGVVTENLAVKNTGVLPLYFVDGNPLVDYNLEVKDAAGNQLAVSSSGETVLRNENFNARVHVKIEPGEEVTTQLCLYELYDFAKPGDYTVVVSRNFAGTNNNSDDVTSNTANITISPRAPSTLPAGK